MDYYPSNLSIEECWYPHNDFCGIAIFKNGEIPDYTCGDDEFCTSKVVPIQSIVKNQKTLNLIILD